MRVARLGGPAPRLAPARLLTAVVAVAIAVLAFVIVTRATAFDPGALSEKPELIVGALWPGILIGAVMEGPPGAISWAFRLAPFFMPLTALVSVIWLIGALGTAAAIDRLSR